MAKFCPKCGVENDENHKFCKGCGASLNSNIHSIQKNKLNSKKQNKDKDILIIVAAIVVCIAIVAGAFVCLSSVLNSEKHIQEDPIHIINTTFTTGHSLSAKTICTVNLGPEHAGKNVSIDILYSRDGTNLNNGDRYNKKISEDGSVECVSLDSYKKYPDHAVVTVYDENGTLLDSAEVILNTDDSTQVAIGSGEVTATSINAAKHSAGTSSGSSSYNGGSSSSSDGIDTNYHYDSDMGEADTTGKVYSDGSVEAHTKGSTKYGDYEIDSYMDSKGKIHGSVKSGGYSYSV
ncbi:MAG: zinc-ribbon domain-containing protein [archaeon]|nr:zinc-ribbon domain-containing protein [archaeon]